MSLHLKLDLISMITDYYTVRFITVFIFVRICEGNEEKNEYGLWVFWGLLKMWLYISKFFFLARVFFKWNVMVGGI